MRAFIYAGGDILPENITEHPKSGDLRIAADSGYNNALKLGESVDILIGDFDSIKNQPDPSEVETYQVPAEKNQTDTQIAVEMAIERGADEVIIIGGLGSRMDHSLSTMGILIDMRLRGIHAHISNGYNRITYINSSSTLIPRSGYKYFSIIAADEKVKGVSVEGGKYPLKKAKLERNRQYAVSNEITKNCALISVRRGGIFVIESRD